MVRDDNIAREPARRTVVSLGMAAKLVGVNETEMGKLIRAGEIEARSAAGGVRVYMKSVAEYLVRVGAAGPKEDRGGE